jgi:ABC-type lipoprotein release transport system permease subunit
MKRKLRTFLTILGVTIGISSIIIMLGLGEGMKRESMKMIEEYGGLRTVEVREGGGPGSSTAASQGTESTNPLDTKLTDNTMEKISHIEHVEQVYPVLDFQAIIQTGAYMSSLYGGKAMPLDVLKDMNWEFAEGDWPKEGDELKFVYGNMVLQDFCDLRGNSIYWSTGKLPDIDLMNDKMFTIFDVEAYEAAKGNSAGSSVTFVANDNTTGTTNANGNAAQQAEETQKTQAPKKYIIEAAGILAGGQEDYKEYSWNTYCDIEALKNMYKKVFKNKPIPGQPLRKNGKPYNELFYSSFRVIVDDIENVTAVQTEIGDMGFQTNSNSEWIAQQEQQSKSQQALLGGIGAVSLLVAAIGIANTMMMSIYERTKEIGVMKVLGCGLFDIQQLFLIEAGIIGLFGGLLGLVLSVIICFIINKVSGMQIAVIPPWMYILSIVFAVLVSMGAGFAPSRRAMRLSALEAIRNN